MLIELCKNTLKIEMAQKPADVLCVPMAVGQINIRLFYSANRYLF